MKYIRTKDGIFKRYKNSTIIDNVFYYPDNGGFIGEYRREPILKQADTIEELCDEFACDRKNKVFDIKPVLFNQDYDIQKEKDSLLEKFEIYGAIWIEWGLKYVAKMNEKGDLELL